MAVAFDAKTSTYTVTGSVNTFTITNLTVGSGSNRALAVLLSFTQTAVPTFTKVEWDTGGTNQAMTAISGTGGGTATSSISSVAYGLVAPTSGNKTLTVTWSGSALVAYGVAISFTGVDQTSVAVAFPHGTGTFNTSSTSPPASVTITSATGNMTVAGFCNNSDAFSATNNTQLAPDPVTGVFDVISNYASGAATVTHTGTMSVSDPWVAFGFDVLASGAAATLVTGWWNESADVYRASPLKFSERPAFVSTFRTAAISGSAWNAQRDHAKLPPSVVFSDAPAYGHGAFPPASTISGMAWYEPPDRDAPAKKINIEALPAFVSPFRTAGIAGIAWSGPRDHVRLPVPVSYSYSPAFVSTFVTAPVSGVAWFVTIDVPGIERPQVQQYDPSDVLRPFSAAVGISGMAWFEPPDRDQPAVKVKIESLPAYVRPPTVFTPISGIGWFEPPDRDRPATKIKIEALPAAFVSTFRPATISGMAWFAPRDRDQRSARVTFDYPPAFTRSPFTTITGTLAATEGYDIASITLSFSRWTHKNIQSETWTDKTKQDETWIVRPISSETWTPE